MNNLSVKYAKNLAHREITTRKQIAFNSRKLDDPNDEKLLQKIGTFTVANAHPFIFDALCWICTKFPETTISLNGITQDIIQRQDNPLETHYRTVLPIEKFKEFALGSHNAYWENLRVQIYKLVKNPEKKVMPINERLTILTEPIRIDLLRETLSEDEQKRFAGLKGGSDKKITYIIIEYFKPLFECLLQRNDKGTFGQNFLQLPRALQAELGFTIDKLRKNYILRDQGKKSIDAMDARRIFLYLAMLDNKKGNCININLYHFALSCFPSVVCTDERAIEYNQKKQRKKTAK